MEKFKTTHLSELDLELNFNEVQGERLTIEGIECFMFYDPEETDQGIIEGYNISHLETGMRICNGFTKEDAIKNAKNILITHKDKVQKVIETGRQRIKDLGGIIPVNQ